MDVRDSFIAACGAGDLVTARELVSEYGQPYLDVWSKSFNFFRDASRAAAREAVARQALVLIRNKNKKPAYTPLHYAVMSCDIELIKMILEKGANVEDKNPYGRTPIYHAIEKKNLEITELLLEHGADVNARDKKGISPLHVAAEIGCLQIVEHLLIHGADVNYVCTSSRKKGYAPLHFAIENGNKEIVRLLLNRGANVNVKAEDNITALHIAARKGYIEIAEYLLNNGVSAHSVTLKEEYTPLHLATKMGHTTVVRLLLNKGAIVNVKQRDGSTALHIASQKGYREVVVALLEYGSDINITSKNNQTPLDHARAEIESRSHKYQYPWHKTVETLKRHIVKLKTANLYVSEQNLLSVHSSDDFEDNCKEEIASMKSVKIINTKISFYDILTKDTSSLASYMRNENIVRVLKSDDYQTNFPIYASMIRNSFRKAMERNELLERGILFEKLPPECSKKIFSYLKNEELRMFIDVLSDQVG